MARQRSLLTEAVHGARILRQASAYVLGACFERQHGSNKEDP